jgi:hypothetical protein
LSYFFQFTISSAPRAPLRACDFLARFFFPAFI